MRHKILIVYSLVWIYSLEGFTQDYKRLRVALGGGKSLASESELFYIEPSVHLNNRITLGLKEELFIPNNGRSGQSFSANVQYYLTQKSPKVLSFNQFRFFVGVGISGNTRSVSIIPFTVVSPNGTSQNIYPQEINGQFVPGFYPRFGFDYKHLSFNLEYNFVQKINVSLDIFDPQTAQFIGYSSMGVSNNYLGIKIGIFIGGGHGRKNKWPLPLS